MNIIVKDSPVKVDPKRPQSHPGYAAAQRAAAANVERGLNFTSEGAKSDYIKRVKANPNNIYGLYPFYPPLHINEAVISNNEMTDDEREEQRRDNIRRFEMMSIFLYCTRCEKHQPHLIYREDCFCQKCAKRLPYRTN